MPDDARSPKRRTLNWHLRSEAKVLDALRHVIVDISRAGRDIRYAIQTSENTRNLPESKFGPGLYNQF